MIDEAHRAAAPSYQQILGLFDLGHTSVVGLTATPFRTEYAQAESAGTLHLVRLFQRQIVEPEGTLGTDPRTRLQEMGVLARPVLETLETHVRLHLPPLLRRELSQDEMERADLALRLRADASAARRLRLAERIAEICQEDPAHSVLYFGPSVADAASVAFLLRERGHQAAFVSGNTPEAARRRMIRDFKDGRVRVLCNCEVLTTGFDAPKVTHVVVGRPTVSQVLYEQMVGRGLRGPKFGGTDRCVIVNCKDDYREGSPTLGWVEWRNAWKPEETSSGSNTLL